MANMTAEEIAAADFSIHEKDLEGYIGKRIFLSDRLYDRTPAGVVMGLAWTSMGGATLYIECQTVKPHPLDTSIAQIVSDGSEVSEEEDVGAEKDMKEEKDVGVEKDVTVQQDVKEEEDEKKDEKEKVPVGVGSPDDDRAAGRRDEGVHPSGLRQRASLDAEAVLQRRALHQSARLLQRPQGCQHDRPGARRDLQHLGDERHSHAPAGGCHAQGRTECRLCDHYLFVVHRAQPADQAGAGDDRRDQPEREGAARGRHQGEGDGGKTCGDQ